MSKLRKYHLFTLLSVMMACLLLVSCSFMKSKDKAENKDIPANVQEPIDISPTAETANLALASLVDSFVYGPVLEGGIMTDGGIVNDVRLGKHNGFERLVIEFDSAEVVPMFKASYYRCPESLVLHMNGTGEFYANTPSTEKSGLIQEVYRIATFDETAHRVGVMFKKPVTMNIFEMDNPARIVMDIKEDTGLVVEGVPETVYSLRSGPYDDLEILTYVEQDLSKKENGKNVRILSCEGNQYVVEEGIYSSKGDCEKRKGDLESKGKNYSMYIEEIANSLKNESSESQ